MAAAAALKARQLLEQRMWAESEVSAGSWYPSQYAQDFDGCILEGGEGAMGDISNIVMGDLDIGATCWGSERQHDFSWYDENIIGESWKDDAINRVNDFSAALTHRGGSHENAPSHQYSGSCVSGGSSGSSAPVRKTVDLAAKFAKRKPDLPVTTLMLRNLPNNTSRYKLMSFLDETGFEGTYDFVYLPLDSATHTCLAYAFVNFQDAATAEAFSKHSSGVFLPPDRKRALQISPAHIQGLEANLEHLVSSAVLTGDPALRPWFRQDPKQLETLQWESNSSDATFTEDFMPPARTRAGRNHFEKWSKSALASAKDAATTSLPNAGGSSSSTAIAQRVSPPASIWTTQVSHRLPSIGSTGAASVERRLSGLVGRLNSEAKQREMADARFPERQSRLESLRTQFEASDSKVTFEKSFALMEALLRQALPSPMPSLARLSRSFLQHYTKSLSARERFDAMFALGGEDSQVAPQQSSLALHSTSLPSAELETIERSGCDGLAMEVPDRSKTIASAIADAAEASKRRTLARIAADRASAQVNNPWPNSYGFPVDAHAYFYAMQSASPFVEPLSNAEAETPDGFMNSQAAPFTPGCAAWLPKSGSFVEQFHAKEGEDDKECTDLEDTFLLTQLACPSIHASNDDLAAPISDPPSVNVTATDTKTQSAAPQTAEITQAVVPLIAKTQTQAVAPQETLGTLIEAKPLGIQEWPALGKAAPKGAKKKDQATKRRSTSPPTSSWFVPLLSTEASATDLEDEKKTLLIKAPVENTPLVAATVTSCPKPVTIAVPEADARAHGRLELLAARTRLSDNSPPRIPAGSFHGNNLLPTVAPMSDLPDSADRSSCGTVSRRVASKKPDGK